MAPRLKKSLRVLGSDEAAPGHGRAPASPARRKELPVPDMVPVGVPDTNRLGGWRPALISVSDYESREIWMAARARDDASAAPPLPPPLFSFGPVMAAPDYLWFDGSPAEPPLPGGGVIAAEFGGQSFVLAARQGTPRPLDGGSGMEIPLATRFSLAYAAGRQIEVLVDEQGGFYLELIDLGAQPGPLALPRGFRLRSITLAQDWVTRVAEAARVYFFVPENRSFVGPALTPPVV